MVTSVVVKMVCAKVLPEQMQISVASFAVPVMTGVTVHSTKVGLPCDGCSGAEETELAADDTWLEAAAEDAGTVDDDDGARVASVDCKVEEEAIAVRGVTDAAEGGPELLEFQFELAGAAGTAVLFSSHRAPVHCRKKSTSIAA